MTRSVAKRSTTAAKGHLAAVSLAQQLWLYALDIGDLFQVLNAGERIHDFTRSCPQPSSMRRVFGALGNLVTGPRKFREAFSSTHAFFEADEDTSGGNSQRADGW